MSDDVKPLDPEQAAALARIRRFMMIASVTTFVAIGIVFAIIGYKVYRSGDSAQALAPDMAATPADVTVALPAGAKVVSTMIGNDHIVVTIEVGGTTELRTFDPDTLKPLGRLRLQSSP